MTEEELYNFAEEFANKLAPITDPYNVIQNVAHTTAIQAYIAGVNSRNQWISVEERLPEKYVDCDGVEHDCSDRVIVKLKDGKYTHLAEYYHDTNEWLSLELCSSTDYYDNVTHWMPMPE